jgi:hypothetical protein
MVGKGLIPKIEDQMEITAVAAATLLDHGYLNFRPNYFALQFCLNRIGQPPARIFGQGLRHKSGHFKRSLIVGASGLRRRARH